MRQRDRLVHPVGDLLEHAGLPDHRYGLLVLRLDLIVVVDDLDTVRANPMTCEPVVVAAIGGSCKAGDRQHRREKSPGDGPSTNHLCTPAEFFLWLDIVEQTRPLGHGHLLALTHTGRRLIPTRPERVLTDIVDGNLTR